AALSSAGQRSPGDGHSLAPPTRFGKGGCLTGLRRYGFIRKQIATGDFSMSVFRAALLASVPLALATLPADAGARPMTPEDVARIEQVGTIAIAPNGGKIV